MADESKSFESLQKEGERLFPPDWVREKAYIKSMDEYEAIYKRSVEDPEGFWAEKAEEFLYWDKKWDTVLEYEFETPRDQVVQGRQDERRLQLRRPAPHHVAPQQGRAHLGVGRGPHARCTRTSRCTTRCAASPTCSRSTASRRATASPSTCR